MAAASVASVDLLGHVHDEQMGNAEQAQEGSPGKRRGVGQEEGVSLVLLREIPADQTRTLLQHQTNSQNELKREMQATQGDLKQEIWGDIRREISHGQDALKKEIQADIYREIQSLSKTRTTQFQDLQQAQGHMETRLKALEARGTDSGTTASSGNPGKKNALVLGGWDRIQLQLTCSRLPASSSGT
jgi:hypothetical protein